MVMLQWIVRMRRALKRSSTAEPNNCLIRVIGTHFQCESTGQQKNQTHHQQISHPIGCCTMCCGLLLSTGKWENLFDIQYSSMRRWINKWERGAITSIQLLHLTFLNSWFRCLYQSLRQNGPRRCWHQFTHHLRCFHEDSQRVCWWVVRCKWRDDFRHLNSVFEIALGLTCDMISTPPKARTVNDLMCDDFLLRFQWPLCVIHMFPTSLQWLRLAVPSTNDLPCTKYYGSGIKHRRPPALPGQQL